MARYRMIIAVFVALLAVPFVMPAFADESDAETSIVMKGTGNSWQRTTSAIECFSTATTTNVYYSETIVDDELLEYLQGTCTFDSIGFKNASDLVMNTSYYLYYAGNVEGTYNDTSIYYYNYTTIENKADILFISGEHITVTATALPDGISSVYLGGHALVLNEPANFDYYTGNTVEMYTDKACANFEVTLKIVGEASILRKGTPTENATLATQQIWASTTVNLTNARFPSTYAQYIFPADSVMKQQFIDEVIDTGLDTVPSKFSAYQVGHNPTKEFNGSFEVFGTTYRSWPYMYVSYYDGINYQYINDNSPTTYPGTLNSRITFFVGSGQEFKVCVDWDNTGGSTSVRLIPYSTNRSVNLLAGYEYTFKFNQADEYSIIVDNYSKTAVDISYSINGAAEADGNAPTFAVIAIILCALPFGLLILSARKPAWAK